MFFYTFSTGEYSDYSETIIYNEKEFDKVEFANMYNMAFDFVKKKNVDSSGSIADAMCELYGFKVVESSVEIHAGYGPFRKVTRDDLKGSHTWIRAEGNYVYDDDDED